MLRFCVKNDCSDFASSRSDFCPKHAAMLKADLGATNPPSYLRQKKRAVMMNLTEIICGDCLRADFIPPKFLIRNTRLRCKFCGSVSVQIRRRVAKHSMLRHHAAAISQQQEIGKKRGC